MKAKPFTRLRHLGKSPTQVVLYGSLLLSLIWNGVLVTRFAAEHLTRKVIPNRHLNAVERGADYVSGSTFAEFISVVRDLVPEESLVVLPPDGGEYYLNERWMMRYFLFPRDAVLCRAPEDPQCRALLENDESYVISTGSFPPEELVSHSRLLIHVVDDLGVYVPR